VYSKWTVFVLLSGHRDSKKGGKFLYHSQLQRTTLHGVYVTLFWTLTPQGDSNFAVRHRRYFPKPLETTVGIQPAARWQTRPVRVAAVAVYRLLTLRSILQCLPTVRWLSKHVTVCKQTGVSCAGCFCTTGLLAVERTTPSLRSKWRCCIWERSLWMRSVLRKARCHLKDRSRGSSVSVVTRLRSGHLSKRVLTSSWAVSRMSSEIWGQKDHI